MCPTTTRRPHRGRRAGTTGTDENEEFVGRAAGRDLGYAGETGAEARAEAGGGEPVTTPTGELTGFAKLIYKPFGTVFGILGGLLAGKVFGIIWKRISNEPETPAPLSEDYSTREVLIAATIQGAVFGLITTAVNRYGIKGYRKFLNSKG